MRIWNKYLIKMHNRNRKKSTPDGDKEEDISTKGKKMPPKKVFMEQQSSLPSRVLDQICPDDWNNIPLPLCDAIKGIVGELKQHNLASKRQDETNAKIKLKITSDIQAVEK